MSYICVAFCSFCSYLIKLNYFLTGFISFLVAELVNRSIIRSNIFI